MTEVLGKGRGMLSLETWMPCRRPGKPRDPNIKPIHISALLDTSKSKPVKSNSSQKGNVCTKIAIYSFVFGDILFFSEFLMFCNVLLNWKSFTYFFSRLLPKHAISIRPASRLPFNIISEFAHTLIHRQTQAVKINDVVLSFNVCYRGALLWDHHFSLCMFQP